MTGGEGDHIYKIFRDTEESAPSSDGDFEFPLHLPCPYTNNVPT